LESEASNVIWMTDASLGPSQLKKHRVRRTHCCWHTAQQAPVPRAVFCVRTNVPRMVSTFDKTRVSPHPQLGSWERNKTGTRRQSREQLRTCVHLHAEPSSHHGNVRILLRGAAHNVVRGRTYLGRRRESDQEPRYDSNIITGPPREPGAVAVFHMKNFIGCGRKAQDGTVVVSKVLISPWQRLWGPRTGIRTINKCPMTGSLGGVPLGVR